MQGLIPKEYECRLHTTRRINSMLVFVLHHGFVVGRVETSFDYQKKEGNTNCLFFAFTMD
ncbi:hypothetical protein O9992_16345 [Vibrio lentus]|nr:hypothetical protein [Vibrio lentus]